MKLCFGGALWLWMPSGGCPFGPLGSFNSHDRRTLELILHEGSAFFQASTPRSDARETTGTAAPRTNASRPKSRFIPCMYSTASHHFE
jgi:hypothetical protein